MSDIARVIIYSTLLLALPFYLAILIFQLLGFAGSASVWLVGIGIVLAALGVVVQRLIRQRNQALQLKKSTRVRAIQELGAYHPELVAALEILMDEFQRSGTQSALVGFLQNFAFFVLGVAIPIGLGKLHLI